MPNGVVKTITHVGGWAKSRAHPVRLTLLIMKRLSGIARVEVRLRDGGKLKGYIGEVAADSFTIIDSKRGAPTVVSYADVAEVKKQGSGLSTLTKVLIGATGATRAIIGWQIVKPAVCDGGAQTRGPC